VHRIKDKNVIQHFKTIPYKDIIEVLLDDGIAFLEQTEPSLKRQTVWKAARRLSERLGKKVICRKRTLEIKDNDETTDIMDGYLFEIEE
jgi:hypothetical protein